MADSLSGDYIPIIDDKAACFSVKRVKRGCICVEPEKASMQI
ncbi:hypothetical protein AALA24_13355 [Anaerovoracaceae bacterium 42-11]